MLRCSPISCRKPVAYQDTAELMYWTDTYGCPVGLCIGSWSGLTFLPLAQFACHSVYSCLDSQPRPLIGWPLPDWPVYSCMPAWSSLPVYNSPPSSFQFYPLASGLFALILLVRLWSFQLLLAAFLRHISRWDRVTGQGGTFTLHFTFIFKIFFVSFWHTIRHIERPPLPTVRQG